MGKEFLTALTACFLFTGRLLATNYPPITHIGIEQGAASTFGAQSTFVQPLAGKKEAFIFMADKWNPNDLKNSRYIWLPVQCRGIPLL